MDFYFLEETYQTLKQHKLRSILTGFGVMWGVISLVVLLGLCSGLKKGINRDFKGMSKNSIWMWGHISKSGEFIRFNDKVISSLKKEHKFIKKIGEQTWTEIIKNIFYNNKHHSGGKLQGIGNDYLEAVNISLAPNSRNFNIIDTKKERKVCLLGAEVKKEIFENNNPIGKYINIRNIPFLVIGYLETGKGMNNRLNSHILIPINTFQNTFNYSSNTFSGITILLDNNIDADIGQKKILKSLKRELNIHPSDKNAFITSNIKKQVQKIDNLFITINIFIWAISICFLLGGVVGVGNMMLVVINERIKEIGIRKVIGATPKEILSMLMTESIVITLVSGIIGMILGIMGLNIGNILLKYIDKQEKMMLGEMSFDFLSTIIAIIILIIAGGFAGFIPARKAVDMLPIKALSKE